MTDPAVAGLYTAPHAGAPVESKDWLDLRPGSGVIGDRYALGLGHWSDPRWPDQEVTLFEAEVAAELGLNPGQMRRNIVTQGLRLDSLIGRSFRVGETELAGVRPCDPCSYLEALTRPGLLRQFRGRGGLRARVTRGGRIAVGDRITLLPSPGVKGMEGTGGAPLEASSERIT